MKNKIKIGTPKISLFNNIEGPYNYPRNYTLVISDSDMNIHIENEAIATMAPVIMSKIMTARTPYGNTME